MSEIEPKGNFVGTPKSRYDFVLKLTESRSTTRGYYVHKFIDRNDNHYLMFGDETLYAEGSDFDIPEGTHALKKGDIFKLKATINRHTINKFSPSESYKENVINRPKFGKYLGNLNEQTTEEETI
tara:strand:- start:161 stop:535 length:375 start_codon:yes stop_codon:yes gene_type:complete